MVEVCESCFHLLLVRTILIVRCNPKPAKKQRIIPNNMLRSKRFITANTSVKPAYTNTIIGKYLLTFFVISIISTISFSRSELVLSMLTINLQHRFQDV